MNGSRSETHRRWLRLVAVAGGFLTMVGTLLLGLAVLSASGFLDPGLLLENKYLLIFALATILVGSLDIFAAIILNRW